MHKPPEKLRVLKLYSPRCLKCYALKEIYEKLAESRDDIEWYAFNVDMVGDINVLFPTVNGVPTLCTIAFPGEVKVMVDPETPHPETWYYEKDILNFIEEQINEY